MDQEQQTKLRAPFEAHQIGKLPATQKRPELDYVGHAAVTDRLLAVDPEWTWEPVATYPETGLPMLDPFGGLWIRLTVGGVTRIGYGDETNGKGMKEVIGDAIRNAAMRFGVALDLWSKQPLLDAASANGHSAPRPQAVPTPQSKGVPTTWKELLDHYYTAFYPHPWPEWWAEAAAAYFSLRIETTLPFNGVVAAIEEAKGKEGVKDFWLRLLKTADAIPVSDLGPIRSEVRKAFAENFDGAVLFGPHVSMSAEEANDYPTFEMYKAGDLRPAVEAAADEDSGVETGPSDTAPSEEPGDPSVVTAGAGLGEDAPAPSAPEQSSFQPPAGATEQEAPR